MTIDSDKSGKCKNNMRKNETVRMLINTFTRYTIRIIKLILDQAHTHFLSPQYQLGNLDNTSNW